MAHNLPKDDSFVDKAIGDNGGPRWTRPTLYWPTQLWTNAAETETGYTLVTDLGLLHDGYSTSGTYATKNATNSTTARLANAYTFADYQSDDVVVSGRFRINQVSGNDTFFQDTGKVVVGLIARVTGDVGTSFVNDTDISFEEAVQSPRFYAFVRISRAPAGSPIANYQFWRVTEPTSGGSDSIIDVLKGHPSDPGGPSNSPNIETEMAAGKTFGMKFSVTTNGSVAELRGFWVDEFGVETEVLSYDDGDSTAILDIGHCGTILTSEMIGPSHTSGSDLGVMGMVDFEIRDDTGAIQVRDEFSRTHIRSARHTLADLHGRRGHSVVGKYTGDQSTEGDAPAVPIFDDRLRRGATLERLEIDDDPIAGWHIAYDPASSVYVQARSIEYVFPSGGTTGTRVIGLAQRTSVNEVANFESIASSDVVGYLVTVELTLPGLIWAARVRRYNGDGQTLIASRLLNQSGDPVFFAVDTTEKLSVAIENRDGPSAATGNVHIDILHSDVRLKNWTFSSPGGDGFIEEDDGSLTDTSSSRVLAGEGEGFFAKDPEGDGIYVNSYTSDDPQIAEGDQEQDGTYLWSEKDGKFGTFTIPHEWEFRTRYISYDVALRMDSLHVHRHGSASAQRRMWTVSSRAAKKTEHDDLIAFFRDHNGAELPFDWTLPDGEAVVARMIPRRLRRRKTGPSSYAFSVDMMECLGGEGQVASFLNFKASLVPYSGGGVAIVDTPEGTVPGLERVHPVWHYKDDGVDVAKIEMTIQLAQPAEGSLHVGYEILDDSTAVLGTNYSIDAGSESPVAFATGETEKTISFTPVNPAEYYTERLLKVKLTEVGSTVPLHDVDNELHAYIRSTTPPPSIEFTSVSSSGDPGDLVTFTVEKSGSAHTDPIEIWLRVTLASSAEEGLGRDYRWDYVPTLTPAVINGVYRINPSNSQASISVELLSTATSGQSFTVELFHELDDQSQINRWDQSERLGPKEKGTDTVKVFPGEPSDCVSGPASVAIPDPWDHFFDENVKDPWGNPCPGLQMTNDAIGATYHRKSGEGFIFCNGPEEGLIAMPEYMRFSIYIEVPTEVGGQRTMPRFIRLGFRDRGFQLLNGQAPSNAGSDENYGVVFDREAVGSGVISHSTGEWRVWNAGTQNMGGSSDWGIEEETIRNYLGQTKTYIRLWVTLHQNDPLRIGDACNIIWWPFWFSSNDGTNISGSNLGTNRGKAICAFWPMWEYGTKALVGPPGPYYPRRQTFWEPNGGAVITSGGTNSHTVNIN